MKEKKIRLRLIQVSELVSLCFFVVIFVLLKFLKKSFIMNSPEGFLLIKNNYFIIECLLVFTFLIQSGTNLFLFFYSNHIQKQNDNYNMVSVQSQAVIFSYDYSKKRLDLSGNLKDLCPSEKDVYIGDQVNEILGLIHSDDIITYVQIKNIVNSQKSELNTEVRLKTGDGTYKWFRLSGSVLRNNEGAVCKFVGNVTNVEAEREKEMKLAQKASLDSLTGLLNKGAFEDAVTKLVETSSRNEVFAFYIIDLDYFKTVNDTLGHSIGDQVLQDTAKKLLLIFNEQDIVGRIGGDEFAALLRLSLDVRKISSKIIESKANSICEKLNRIFEDGDNKVNVSASVGVSIYPKQGRSYIELYKNADKVLYISKKNGKNQYTINTEDIQ